MELLRSHGITRDPTQMTHEPHGPWYYQQIALGFNYRMTELQGALGLSQLERLDQYVERRHDLAERYDRLLSDLPVTRPWQSPDSYSARHLYVIRVQQEIADRNHVFASMRAQQIGVNLHYIPIHTQPYYTPLGFKEGDFPNAEQYYREAISLPLFGTMTETQQDIVITALADSIKGCG
jgi:dTDP-4-amino-4,6-dideoxygalactose transaminase